MKKSTKVLSAVLASMFIVGSFGGCKKNEESAGNEMPTLKWYLPMTSQSDQNMVFEEANKLIEEKVGAHIEFMPVDSASYEDKIKVTLSSGEQCDLVWTASWKNNYFQNVSKGAFYDITDLMSQYAPGIVEAVPAEIMDSLKVNGRLYAVPNYQISSYIMAFWLKKDLVDKYGFDYKSVKELKDLEPYLASVKENEKGIYPADNASGRLWAPLMYDIDEIGTGLGVYCTDETAKVFSLYETEEFKNVIALMRDWNKKGYFQPDLLSVKSTTAEYNQGKYGTSCVGNLAYDGETTASIKASHGWDAYEVKITEPVFTTKGVAATLMAVGKSSKYPEKALEVLNYVNTDPEVYNLLSFGIEGKHYNKLKENYIELIPDSGYKSTNWIWGNTFNGYVVSPKDEKAGEKTLETHAKATNSVALGFAMDYTNVSSEVSQCTSVINEYKNALTTGSVDIEDAYDTFISNLKTAGIDKLVAEAQKQMDAFLAAR